MDVYFYFNAFAFPAISVVRGSRIEHDLLSLLSNALPPLAIPTFGFRAVINMKLFISSVREFNARSVNKRHRLHRYGTKQKLLSLIFMF